MDINKRTILWIVFSISLFWLVNSYRIDNGMDSLLASPKPVAAVKTAPGVPAAPTDLPGATTVTGTALPGVPSAPAAVKGELVTITTDVMRVQIDTAGGAIKYLELLKYKDAIDKTKNKVLFDINPKGSFLAQTGLIGNVAGAVLPNHHTIFTARPGVRSIDGGDKVELVLEAEQAGIKLTKTYVFKRGVYVIDLRHDVSNTGTTPVNPSLYMELLHHGNKPEGETYFTSSYTGPIVSTPAKNYEKLDFKTIQKREGKTEHTDHVRHAADGYVAIAQHYFVSAFLPQEKVAREIYTKEAGPNLYTLGVLMPVGAVQPGATVSNAARLYSGPMDENKLKELAPNLELVKDYGLLTILAEPIFKVLDLIHSVLGNWGWTIIAFTVLIKLLFFPLSAAGYKSMAKIKMVTPKMTAIRERYKGDPAKMNQATMELYKTEKINPLGGCLPILVQMPVFLALFWVLQSSAEMYGAPWIGWIKDLTAPDPYFILPVLYAISMWITTKLNPAPADPMQAKMMLWMPLIFSVAFFFFPSGLVLYWVVNNILSIGQQYVITKKYAVADAPK
ncbi:MAG: membrane protein insertase YidC [Pseudomonadota bacterium]